MRDLFYESVNIFIFRSAMVESATSSENNGSRGDSVNSDDGIGPTPELDRRKKIAQTKKKEKKKRKKKKSHLQEVEPFPTLDLSAQVRKNHEIIKSCTLPTNLMITFLSLLFW